MPMVMRIIPTATNWTAATSSRLLLKGSLVTNTGVTISTGPANKGGASSILAANGYLPSIFFDLNSSVIALKYNETLASIALVMRNNPDIKFDISGNLRFTREWWLQCETLKTPRWSSENHLVKKYNIDASRLNITSLERKNQSQKDHPMNRRVDFKVLNKFYESIMRGSLLRGSFFGCWLMVDGCWFLCFGFVFRVVCSC